MVVREADVALIFLWKQGYFLRMNVWKIFERLARWYDVNIFLKIRLYESAFRGYASA
ncbi:MAG: hypothetical protein ACLU4N_00510 [Butyricimonas faecihominis]